MKALLTLRYSSLHSKFQYFLIYIHVGVLMHVTCGGNFKIILTFMHNNIELWNSNRFYLLR